MGSRSFKKVWCLVNASSHSVLNKSMLDRYDRNVARVSPIKSNGRARVSFDAGSRYSNKQRLDKVAKMNVLFSLAMYWYARCGLRICFSSIRFIRELWRA